MRTTQIISRGNNMIIKYYLIDNWHEYKEVATDPTFDTDYEVTKVYTIVSNNPCIITNSIGENGKGYEIIKYTQT